MFDYASSQRVLRQVIEMEDNLHAALEENLFPPHSLLRVQLTETLYKAEELRSQIESALAEWEADMAEYAAQLEADDLDDIPF